MVNALGAIVLGMSPLGYGLLVAIAVVVVIVRFRQHKNQRKS
jgi:hypothetical protein